MGGDAGPAFMARFLFRQLFGQLPKPTASFAGKTVIVTGANQGLGYEAAKHIINLGAAKLIIAVRSIEKGEIAKQTLEQATGCSTKLIEVWQLDLASYDSVKEFAARASRDLARIDVLLENAGVAMTRWDWAEDNELSVTVNVTSTFLLAFLLLPKLKETATKFNTRPVLTVVSSETHFAVDFEEGNAPEGIFNNLADKNKANMAERYPTSKLMEVFVVHEMAQRKPSYPVTINMVNPGLCESELAREGGFGLKVMKFLFARTTEQGSRTLVAGAGAGPETHGKYMDMCAVAPTSTLTTSDKGKQIQKRLWSELMVKLDGLSPGVSGNL